jgi:hypothetical protein
MRFFSNDARRAPDDQATVDEAAERSAAEQSDQSANRTPGDEHPERVQSEPVAVPQQRPASPSPWAASPGNRPSGLDTDPDADESDGDVAARAARDASPEQGDRADRDDRPAFHEPGPVPTAFGASTVGGAVAASAVANPQGPGAAGPDSADDLGLQSDNRDGTAAALRAFGSDQAFRADTDDRRPGGTGPNETGPNETGVDDLRSGDSGPDDRRADELRSGDRGPDDRSSGDVIDLPLEDGGTFEDPVVVEPGGDARTFAGTASPHGAPTSTDPDETGPDETGFDRTGARAAHTTPTDADSRDTDSSRDAAAVGVGTAAAAGLGTAAVGTAAVRSHAADTSDGTSASAVADRADDRTTAAPDSASGPADIAASVPPGDSVAAVPTAQEPVVAEEKEPVEKLPGTVTPPELGPLFADSDAHSFRDRWRDVQLRFVDDPKAAADDAATLVDEAVDALAASLRTQKAQLAEVAEGATGDTEQLRVRIRGYRDFLDRLLDL